MKAEEKPINETTYWIMGYFSDNPNHSEVFYMASTLGEARTWIKEFNNFMDNFNNTKLVKDNKYFKPCWDLWNKSEPIITGIVKVEPQNIIYPI